jgi:hypothetical protein
MIVAKTTAIVKSLSKIRTNPRRLMISCISSIISPICLALALSQSRKAVAGIHSHIHSYLLYLDTIGIFSFPPPTYADGF